MTTLRKLTIALTLALGIQFSAGAFVDNTQNQKSLILTFAQDLRNQNSTQAQTVAKWLDEQAIGESWGHYQTVIDVITNNNLTNHSKLTLLSEIITKEKSDNRKRAAQQFVSDVCAFTLCVGTCGLVAWAIIEDIKNPRPRVYYSQPKPGISITYTQKYPSWPLHRYSYTYVLPY
jgi:hypothetical protein